MGEKKRVAVIFGGRSAEHEVSRLSAEAVLKNIDRKKYDVVMIGITKEGKWLPYNGPLELLGTGEWETMAESRLREQLGQGVKDAGLRERLGQDSGETKPGGQLGQDMVNDLLGDQSGKALLSASYSIKECSGDDGSQIDVVFPVLHGCNGEDGTIQGFFELAGLPYVGSGVLGSAVCMDKAYAKIIFEKHGIPLGRYLVFTRKRIDHHIDEVMDETEDALTYPCFIKPSNSGSSIGISKVKNRTELETALKLAARYDRRIIAEEFIDGQEIECAVLGNDNPKASVVGEIIPCNEFYDYEAKYLTGDSSKSIIPADLPDDTEETIRDYSVKAFKALDCAGLARVDFFVQKGSGKVYINEINTMPGFTQISMYSKLWAASGVPYRELIERLIELALEQYNDSLRDVGCNP